MPSKLSNDFNRTQLVRSKSCKSTVDMDEGANPSDLAELRIYRPKSALKRAPANLESADEPALEQKQPAAESKRSLDEQVRSKPSDRLEMRT